MEYKSIAEKNDGKWVSFPCWFNCGGRCVNKVLMKDGRVVRQKTDDTHEDSYDWPQNRGCLMGRSIQQLVFDENRLKYPMKRKHWQPLTGGDKSKRGVDTWVRISWDEALTAIANEIEHAVKTYGNRSILYMNLINTQGYLGGVLSAYGGYVDGAGTQSIGTFGFSPHLFGLDIDYLEKTVNDRFDHENSDYIVLYGLNAVWAAFGNPSYFMKYAKKAGCKFVFVGPEYSVTAGFTDAKWIPVRPGADTALLLGVAHTMLIRDENGTLIDWDYLNRCTVGFDKEHMPADARTDENFVEYLMGAYDGIEKTAEWASEICGTPVEFIVEFAEILGCKNNVSIHSNGAPARNNGAENFPHLLMTVAAMGGHFGKPGNACSNDQYYSALNSGPKLARIGACGPPWQYTTAGNPVDDVIPTSDLWDAVLDGKYTYVGNVYTGQYVPAEERKIDIHVLISEQHNFLQSQANLNKGINAFRHVDFVCSQAYSLKTDAKYADIVLPITTRWETLTSNFYYIWADKESVFAHRQVMDPMFESKSDWEVAKELSDRLGIDFASICPDDEKQMWFNQIISCAAREPDGTYVPVATITQDDIERYGVRAEPQEGKIPLEKFLDDGVYRVKRSKNDDYYYIHYQDFRENPELNPRASASGKMEIYCQAKADFFDMINGYANGGSGIGDYVRVSALPTYLPVKHGYEDIASKRANNEEVEYPYQMTHAHYLRRAHTALDDSPWTREALQNPIFINKQDAASKGVSNGDIVKVYNQNGSYLRPASVSRHIMPGVVIVPHGANVKIDETTGIDLAGADNILTNSGSSSPLLDTWNSTLVNFEKYEGDIEIKADYLTSPEAPTLLSEELLEGLSEELEYSQQSSPLSEA